MNWLDRTLCYSPYYYCLCTTEKMFHKELKRLKVPRESWRPFQKHSKANATTSYYEKDDGKVCAIITMPIHEDYEGTDVAAILVHEAVHVWQAILEHIGEPNPSAEFEAYAIQNISQNLMEAYVKQRGLK